MNAMNDCGHPQSAGIAGTPAGGAVCYPCAEALEIAAFARAGSAFAGYVTGTARRAGEERWFTTWTGGKLAKVTSYRVSAFRYTPSGGRYRMRYITAEAPDGSMWHGQGSDSFDLVTLRRSRQR